MVRVSVQRVSVYQPTPHGLGERHELRGDLQRTDSLESFLFRHTQPCEIVWQWRGKQFNNQAPPKATAPNGRCPMSRSRGAFGGDW